MRFIKVASVVPLVVYFSGCGMQSEAPPEVREVVRGETASLKLSSVERATATSSVPRAEAKKSAIAKAAPSLSVSQLEASPSSCWNLSQGPKNNDLGDVCVANDGDAIYVTYTTNGSCLLTEVHVCAALSDYPWTPPGQCSYNAEFAPNPTNTTTVVIPLSDFPNAFCAESTFYIQAHAALDCTSSGGGNESAYGNVFKGKIAYVPQCIEEEEGCTLTQGYWKNHPEDWSEAALTLGGATYSHTEAMALLETAVKGDASLILAHQLIAAKLNGQVGGASTGAIASVIADADAWLAANSDSDGALPFGVPAESDAGSVAVALSSALDDYNNGLTGPGHCED